MLDLIYSETSVLQIQIWDVVCISYSAILPDNTNEARIFDN